MKRRHQAFLSLVITGSIHGMVHSLSLFLSPLNAEVARYFHLESIAGVTAFKTTYLLVYAASNLVFGALTNRISARLTLGLGIILNGAAVMAFRFVPPQGIVMMHALWFVCAIGGGVYHPVANVFITRLYPERKGWALGVTGSGSGIGYAFGPFLTGFLSAFLLLSWRDIALVFGALAVAAGAAALVWIRDIRDTGEGSPAAGSAGSSGSSDSPGSGGLAGTDAAARARVLGLSFGLMCFLAFVVVISGTREIGMWTILDISDFYVSGIRGAPMRTAWIFFFMYLPAIFAQPSVGSLSDRIGRRKLSVIALLGYGTAMIVTAFVPGGLLVIPYVVMGFTQSSSTPLLEGLVADYTTPRTRGLIFGIYITAITGIGALGPLGGGVFLDFFGRTAESFRALFVIMGLMVCLGGGAMIFSGRMGELCVPGRGAAGLAGTAAREHRRDAVLPPKSR
ncbi:MAG: MFS transporter [Spirochaetales bacterium]|jgi:MFS family permease|nr:MFS transporter [Spirochaetales bacterium]